MIPKFVQDVIDGLHKERLPLASRIDAIDLSLENLRRVWPDDGFEEVSIPPGRRETGSRRATLLVLIGKSAKGLTAGELRAKTPAMSNKERGNDLQRLKAAKEIRRVRGRWVANS